MAKAIINMIRTLISREEEKKQVSAATLARKGYDEVMKLVKKEKAKPTESTRGLEYDEAKNILTLDGVVLKRG